MITVNENIENFKRELLKNGFNKETEEEGVISVEAYTKQLITLEIADVNQITSIAVIVFSNGNIIYNFGIKKISDEISDIILGGDKINFKEISTEQMIPVFTGWIQSIDIMKQIFNACFQKILTGEENSLRHYIERSILVHTTEVTNELKDMDRISMEKCISLIEKDVLKYKHQMQEMLSSTLNSDTLLDNDDEELDDNKIISFPNNPFLQ